MDYGICKGKRKGGQPCTMPVNKAEGGGYCEFHVVAAFNRAQRKDPLRTISKGSTGSSSNSSNSINYSSNTNANSKLNSTANFLASGIYGCERLLSIIYQSAATDPRWPMKRARDRCIIVAQFLRN